MKCLALWLLVMLGSGCGRDDAQPTECRQSLVLVEHGDDAFVYGDATCRAFFAENSGAWQALVSVNNKPSFGKISKFAIGETALELTETDLTVAHQKAMLKNAQKGPLLPLEGGEVSLTITFDPELVSVDLLPHKIDLLIYLADY